MAVFTKPFQSQSDQDERESVIAAERPRQPFELQPMSRLRRACARHGERKKIEFLDHESERKHGQGPCGT